MTLEEFAKLVAQHDLTYMYSDDGRCYSRGSRELYAIKQAAESFSRDEVVRIWNAEVDRKLVEDVRPEFYWR